MCIAPVTLWSFVSVESSNDALNPQGSEQGSCIVVVLQTVSHQCKLLKVLSVEQYAAESLLPVLAVLVIQELPC